MTASYTTPWDTTPSVATAHHLVGRRFSPRRFLDGVGVMAECHLDLDVLRASFLRSRADQGCRRQVVEVKGSAIENDLGVRGVVAHGRLMDPPCWRSTGGRLSDVGDGAGRGAESKGHNGEEVARRAGVGRRAIEALAEADAFAGLGATRREAMWEA